VRTSFWLSYRLRLAGIVMPVVFAAGCTHGSSTAPSDVSQVAGVCPAPVTAQSPSGQPVTITFGDPQVSGATQPVTTACAPPSGTAFPVGTTAVACTVTDARQRSASCSFTVRVIGPPRLSTTTILAFGDSITFGTSPPDPPDSYPTRLQAKLTSRYSTQKIVVINDGKPGENAQAGALTREQVALDLYKPGAILLMEGSNDILGGAAGAAAGLAALTDMVRAARARGVAVFLATIPPQAPPRTGVAQAIPAFDDGVKAIAQREGVMLVDIFAAMGGDGRYIGRDGEHPTADGFEVMAQTFFAAIQQKLELPD